MTHFTEHPPVPNLIREQLKDHPELIAELEESLKSVGRRPGMSKPQLTDQFEAAIWCLEDKLGGLRDRCGRGGQKSRGHRRCRTDRQRQRERTLDVGVQQQPEALSR